VLLSVPVIVAVVFVETGRVLTVNVALVAPATTTTLAGTVALDELEDSVTVAPPVGAWPFNVTVPVDELPPATEAGLSEMPVSTAGVIVKVAV
jgi:hypothetical protein